ncbi:MAG TPA: VOC family protein [Euzebyales bacterium]|nr:VOC family protein [Euzebyales bacterium]
MGTRLYSVVIDCADPFTLGRWWSRALGWPVTFEAPDEVAVEPADDDVSHDLAIVFVPVPEPKTHKNRVHLDLSSRSTSHQGEVVERLVSLGATHTDIGQEDVSWVVLADPEDNELCVLGPDDRFDEQGTLEAIVVDATNPGMLARFWAAATGWHVAYESHMVASLRHPSGKPPALDLVAVSDPKPGKNRVHLDVAPNAGDDQEAEVNRLLRLGARAIDIGQGPDVTWVVLADPEDNEFCVLSPR